MQLEQLALQLGLAGFLVLVWYRLELIRIKNHAVTEDKKTAALTVGFQSLGGKIDTHTSADLESHARLLESVSRVEGKFDAILDGQERNNHAKGKAS